MATKKDLAKLEWVEVRTVWDHEAADFTPWLADNIDRLSEALGMDIELNEREAPVGSFSADLVGTDVSSERLVVIENQLEATDHSHLGQLLTYAAGRDAGVVVWVSPSFREEHRQALDWLNENSVEGLDFLGVKVRVAKIADSALAPHFEVVATPNEWTRSVRQAAETAPSELRQARHDFFESFLEELKRRAPGITNATKVGFENWITLPAGQVGLHYGVVFASGQRFQIELYIDFGLADQNKAAFDRLHSQKAGIEHQMGSELEWQRLDGKRACRILLQSEQQVADLEVQSNALREWAIVTLLKFRETFRPLLPALKSMPGGEA